jgi:phosphohistidine phosphatase
MTLFLVQHGEARLGNEDSERSLTDHGAKTVSRVADWAARIGIKVDQIRHSGKLRAEQTATIFAKKLDTPNGVIGVKGLNPNDEVTPVAESLHSEQEPILIVGHLPHLSRLAGMLVTGNPDNMVVRFRDVGIVCLCRHEESWAIDWVMQPDLLAKA